MERDEHENSPDELIYFNVLMPPHTLTCNMLVDYNLSLHKFWKKDYCKVVFALDFSVYHYVANFLDIITLIVRLIPLPLFNIAPTPRTEGF